jgi:imidazoleglycerol-phosphate dehydratase
LEGGENCMTKQLGMIFKEASEKRIEVTRTTLESIISLVVEDSPRRNYKIQTSSKFFNHMLTGIASRACLNVDLTCEPTTVDLLDHVIVEDTGLTFGRAIRELIDARQTKGVMQRGSYTVAFDEALITVTLAFDGRAYCYLRGEVPGMQLEWAEDTLSTNIRQFFEGFAQGAGCVVQIQFWSGEDSHHTWEATFKAFGEAIRESLLPCPYRAGTTIGLKGTGMEGKL